MRAQPLIASLSRTRAIHPAAWTTYIMKLDRIYTRSGDDGRTSLGDGARLPKFHTRVEAYGGIDEANAVIGIALLHVADDGVRDALSRIQNDLFDLGADLCRP